MHELASAGRAGEATLPIAIAMVAADGERAALAGASRGLVRLEYCHNLADAQARLLRGDASMFIARRRDANGAPVDSLVRDLLASFPHFPVIIVSPSADAVRRDARAFRQIGVTRVVREDAAAVRQGLRDVLARERFRLRRVAAAARCASWAPLGARDAIRYAIEHGHTPRSVRDLAMALGVPRKTLDRRLSRVSPLTARQAIGWGRLIATAIQLDPPTATVASVAAELEFTSATALRNLLQRYTGMTPTELRNAGGLSSLLAMLHVTFGARH
jgi:AraC-like DNA-binding protein